MSANCTYTNGVYKYTHKNTVSITYNANGGTCDTPTQSVTAGKEIGTMPAPVRDGYIFDGWYTSANGGTRIYEDHVFTQNTTLYAQWRNDYVDLGSDFYAYLGNVACGHGIVIAGDNVELGISHSVASLWRFIRQSNGSYKILNAQNGLALDVYDAGVANWTNVWAYEDNSTLAQRWYIRRTELGDGYVLHSAASGKALDVYYGSADSKPGDNVQIYTANGSAAQIMYIDTPELVSGVDGIDPLTLLTGNSHGITMTVNGTYTGAWTLSARDTAGILDLKFGSRYDNSMDLSVTPTKAGTTVLKVMLVDANSNESVDMVYIDIIVSDTYSINFVSLDERFENQTETITANAGESVVAPEPYWDLIGRTFTGWGRSYSSSIFCRPGDEISSTSVSSTFYAKYKNAEEIPATTTFVSQDVTPVYPIGRYWYTYTPDVSTSYMFISADAVDNYIQIFDGTDERDLIAYGYDEHGFMAECHLTAGQKYYIGVFGFSKPVQPFTFFICRGYEVNYNANGGSGAPGTTYSYSGVGGNLSATIPARSGYTFLGWSASSTATEATYAAGSRVNLNENTTLYAVWKNNNSIRIVTQPKTTYARQGANATVSVSAVGDGLTYKWYYKDVGDSKFYRNTSFTGTSYSVNMSTARHGRQVYCVITDRYGNSVKTNTVALRLAVTITSQPKTTYARQGATAAATVSAVGEGLTYKWYYKDAGASKFYQASVTGNTYGLPMNETRNGRQVYCIVSDRYGHSVKTNTVALRLAVTITAQPKTTYARQGATAAATVNAVGEGLTYKWYYKDVGSSRFYRASVTGNTYGLPMNEARNGRQVYCIVSDRYGHSIKTNTVALRLAATITKQPVSVTVAEGSKATVKVTAVGDGLTYKWYYKDVGASRFYLASVTGNTYGLPMNAARNGRQVYCIVSDRYGHSVKSNVVTLSMK